MIIRRKTILMTGVTGFIGSYLASAFLRQGFKIIALTRNDPDGQRTRAAIDTALHQDISGIAIHFNDQLKVLPYDFEALALGNKAELEEVDEVWHCAAEMSFSPRKLESSFYSNVSMTSDLYRVIAEGSSQCKRFFYMSTAYTGGAETGLKKEVLHTNPQLINSYQVTKWSTEMSLAMRVMQGARVPVTLFRPSVVIGDTRTGYYPGSPFGIYMYFQAMGSAKFLGANNLTLDLNVDSPLQLVPIEVLIGNAVALSARSTAGDASERLEIFHSTGQAVSNSLLLKCIMGVLDLEVKVGSPVTTLDFFADKICSWVKRFGNGSITFDDSHLRRALGDAFVPTDLGVEQFTTLFSWYHERMISQQSNQSTQDRLKRKVGLQLLDRFATRKGRERVANRMLKRRPA